MANWKINLGDDATDFVWQELGQGNLRAGWGFENCDLRALRELGHASRSNYQQLAWSHYSRLLTEVDRGDRVFTPNFPERGQFSVFEVVGEYGFADEHAHLARGHTLPVNALVTAVPATNQHVTGRLRGSVWARGALTRMGAPEQDISELLSAPLDELRGRSAVLDRLSRAVSDATQSVADALGRDFRGKEFEQPVRELMSKLYPGARIETGRQLDINGIDVLVCVADPLGLDREIAVQVKHWTSQAIVEQLRDEALGALRRAHDARGSIDAGVVLTLLDEIPAESLTEGQTVAEELGIDVVILDRDQVAALFLAHLTNLNVNA